MMMALTTVQMSSAKKTFGKEEGLSQSEVDALLDKDSTDEIDYDNYTVTDQVIICLVMQHTDIRYLLNCRFLSRVRMRS